MSFEPMPDPYKAQHAENVPSSLSDRARTMGGMNAPIATFAGPYPCRPCHCCGYEPDEGDRIYATDEGILCDVCAHVPTVRQFDGKSREFLE